MWSHTLILHDCCTSKIYINIVKSTMLPHWHPPTKDQSVFTPSKFAVFCSATPSCPSIMRTFNFTLLAVLSYVAVIGATPLSARAPAEAIDRRDGPVDCYEYPDDPACVDICAVKPELWFCKSEPPTSVDRREGPVDCDDDPDDLACVDICAVNPELWFCKSEPSTSVDRREVPVDCDGDRDDPLCEEICDLDPESC